MVRTTDGVGKQMEERGPWPQSISASKLCHCPRTSQSPPHSPSWGRKWEFQIGALNVLFYRKTHAHGSRGLVLSCVMDMCCGWICKSSHRR